MKAGWQALLIEATSAIDHVCSGEEAVVLTDKAIRRVEAEAVDIAKDRPSASWLYVFRRLRGLDAGNSLSTTAPYYERLIDVLAGRSTVIQPGPALSSEHFGVPVTEDLLFDAIGLSECAWVLYTLHSVRKRAAKGYTIRPNHADLPGWLADAALDTAVSLYDARVESAQDGPHARLGVSAEIKRDDPTSVTTSFVPLWYPVSQGAGLPEPGPHLLEFEYLAPTDHLDVPGLVLSDADHAAAIAGLWAAFTIAYPDLRPSGLHQMTTQWGYLVIPPALWRASLRAACSALVASDAGGIEPGLFADHQAVGRSLMDGEGRLLPPVPGRVVHRWGDAVLVDVSGMTRRLLATLERPTQGATANAWGTAHELSVQAALDASPWCPPAPLRPLIRKTVSKPNGGHLTDLDAVGFRDGVLLFASCKSRFTSLDEEAGEFALIRNAATAAEDAVTEWNDKIEAIRHNPQMLGVPLTDVQRIIGVVVRPLVPWARGAALDFVDQELLGELRAACSVLELKQAIAA